MRRVQWSRRAYGPAPQEVLDSFLGEAASNCAWRRYRHKHLFDTSKQLGIFLLGGQG